MDDLPDPPTSEAEKSRDPLEILADDLQAHEFDLRRTVRLLAASRAFRLASTHPEFAAGSRPEFLEAEWAVFPVVRLRPEQFLQSLRQAAAIEPLESRPHLFARAVQFKELNSFLHEYGEAAGDDFAEQPATIPQTLLNMNGRFTRRQSDVTPMSGPGRIALFSAGDEACLETCYLACLSRRPTPTEREYFVREWREANSRDKYLRVEDLFWTLFNSPEFGWNH